ncbi:P-loop containing nucleoside triphosphate hydrolase protein, partial [Rhodocollybia butyracea]
YSVMGSTGTGKSSFIRTISGDQTVRVGSNLHSETLDIQRVEFTERNSGRKVTLVDTPGFDDSDISDTDILKMITNFLLNEYDANRKLNGIVYLQRISDPRFGGQNKRTLRMFQKLCGTDTYRNIVVVTTFWDKVSDQEGQARESQMKSSFFRELVDRGAAFMRHTRDLGTAQKVIDHIFTLHEPTFPMIVKEIREDGKNFIDTAAGSMQREEVDKLITKHNEDLAALEKEM